MTKGAFSMSPAAAKNVRADLRIVHYELSTGGWLFCLLGKLYNVVIFEKVEFKIFNIINQN